MLTIGCRGGEEVLLDVGGQDSTEAFEDVGHSDEAREILEGLLVGSLKRQVRPPVFYPHYPQHLAYFSLSWLRQSDMGRRGGTPGTVPRRHAGGVLGIIYRNQC
jgi:hypothetical protein